MTRFIYHKGSTYVDIPLGQGELLDMITPRLKSNFRVPQANELLICHKPITDNTIRGMMLKAPIHKPLNEVYCYDFPSDQISAYFWKVTIDGFSCMWSTIV